MWVEKLGKQLGRPTRSLGGWLVSKLFKSHNRVLEENAVQLCGIQPGDMVLELGHGPGLGLESAAKLLTGPTGRLIGVDYSEYMHKVTHELLTKCKYQVCLIEQSTGQMLCHGIVVTMWSNFSGH